MEKQKDMEITTTVKLPKAMVAHMSAVTGLPPEEALALMVEVYFGETDVENLEPALLNRCFESEEQAVLALHEFCARVGLKRWPKQRERVRAHWARQMASRYLVRCFEYGWGVEIGVRATFAE